MDITSLGLLTIKSKLQTIFLPSTALEDAPDLRAKTEKAFRIARSLAIFRVDQCIVYRDPFITKKQHQRYASLIQLLLEYLECPQYLRKRLFPMHSLLVFVGILPPLATSHHFTHPPSSVGEIREAAVFLSQRKVVAEVGWKRPIIVSNPPSIRFSEQSKRLTIRITNLDPPQCEILAKPLEMQKKYWGYKVRASDALLSHAVSNYDGLIAATSKKCSPLQPADRLQMEKSKNVAVLFGSPSKGLDQILKAEQKTVSEIAQFCFSVTRNPGTRTIRLEEAILLALASYEGNY